MTYFLSFISCGIICAISQFVLEKTKLTPGHMNTILVITGCALSGLHIYDKLLSIFGCGISTTIMNFGHLLVSGASEGYKLEGIIGLFNKVLSNAGAGISFSIFCAFIISIIFKVKH